MLWSKHAITMRWNSLREIYLILCGLQFHRLNEGVGV